MIIFIINKGPREIDEINEVCLPNEPDKQINCKK